MTRSSNASHSDAIPLPVTGSGASPRADHHQDMAELWELRRELQALNDALARLNGALTQVHETLAPSE